jgi:hypothetical protein
VRLIPGAPCPRALAAEGRERPEPLEAGLRQCLQRPNEGRAA